MAREYNINEIEFEDNDDTSKAELLTGEYLKGISKGNNLQPNTEVEKDEYIKFPDQSVVKAVGGKHEEGGIDVAIPDGTEVISDNLKPTKKQKKEIEKMFDITVSDSDTYAKLVAKFTKKIGLEKLNDDQAKTFEKLEMLTKNTSIPKATAEVNLEYLSSKIKQLEDKKKAVEPQRKSFFDYIYGLQQDSKSPSEKDNTFKYGGTQIQEIAKQFNIPEDKVKSFLENGGKKLPQYVEGDPPAVEAIEFKTEANLTDEDKKVIKEKWNGQVKDYINFVNSKEAILKNDELKQDIHQQYQKDIASDEAYTAKRRDFKDKYYKDLSTLKADDVVQELLDFEERNARLKAYGLDVANTDQNATGKSKVTNKQTEEFIEKNPALKDLKFDKGYRGQAAYISYYNTLTQNEKYKDQNLGEFQQGVGDEIIFGKKAKVSGIDNFNTNTTLGQRLNFNWSKDVPKTIPATVPEQKTEGKAPEEKTTVGATTPIEDLVAKYLYQKPNVPRAFYTPDQTPLPPTPVQPVLKTDLNFGRIDPVRVGIETQLREVENQNRFVASQLEGMPETQKASALAMMMANSNESINKAATSANQINAQNISSAELFNIGQADKEAVYDRNSDTVFQNTMFAAQAKAEEQLRRFYDQMNKVNITNLQNNQKLNLIDSVFPDYSLDFSGSRVNFDPENPNAPLIRDSFLNRTLGVIGQ